MYKGISLSLTASVLFAVQYYLASLLPTMDGYELFGWRSLIAFPLMTLFMLFNGEWRAVSEIAQRIVAKPWLLLGIIISSGLMALQQWLFIWASLNGRGINVSLGYFLLPLLMVLVGRVIYKERLSALKIVATWVAAAGVIHQVYEVGGFSWEALTVAIGFICYFVLRRWMQTATLGGFWFDMVITMPFALWCVWGGAVFGHSPEMSDSVYWVIAIFGVNSAAAFMSYISASKLLPFTVFGLLGYVEPVLLLLIALVLGETIHANERLTYLAIWGAVMLLVLEGVVRVIRSRRYHT